MSASSTTVVIAAYDLGRWPLLLKAVRSALAEPALEVVVAVDHNPELRLRLEEEIADPRLRVVANDRLRGASTTRNTGALAAQGEWLAFLDDDAAARPGWLTALVAPLTDPAVVGTGGGVVPAWAGEQPPWFPDEFGWVVGASYRGLPEETAPVRNVWSENMAVRTADFRDVGGFREGFGKVGQASRPEDTEFCVRLAAAHPGSTWLYVPDAVVEHHVPAQRSSFGFFVRRCYAEGRGKAALAQLVGAAAGTSSERAYATRTLPAGVAREARCAVAGHRGSAAKAASIVTGVATAAVGYAHERLLLTRRRA